MTRDLFWTLGGVFLLSTAAGALLWIPIERPQVPAEKAAPTNHAVVAESSSSSKPTVEAKRKSVPTRSAVHWSSAPYIAADDVFAVILQPSRAKGSPDLAAIEELTGESLLRDVAERTDWIAVYGQSAARETEIAQSLTIVVHQTHPTTAIDVAAQRFEGRELTDLTIGGQPYIRVAPTQETVAIERTHAPGEYKAVEATVDHPAMAVMEHDTQTYLILPESQLERRLQTAAADLDLAHRLQNSPPDALGIFVCGPSGHAAVDYLVRAGGDRAVNLLKPALNLMREAQAISVSASLDLSTLVELQLVFPDQHLSARNHHQLVALRDQTVGLIEDLAAASTNGSHRIGMQLLKSLRFGLDARRLTVSLPRPADIRNLVVGESQAAKP
jgi:hypothetical protein